MAELKMGAGPKVTCGLTRLKYAIGDLSYSELSNFACEVAAEVYIERPEDLEYALPDFLQTFGWKREPIDTEAVEPAEQMYRLWLTMDHTAKNAFLTWVKQSEIGRGSE